MSIRITSFISLADFESTVFFVNKCWQIKKKKEKKHNLFLPLKKMKNKSEILFQKLIWL